MILYMARLGDLERAGSRTVLHIGPFTAMTLIGALQLVLRHPNISNTSADVIHGLIEQLQLRLVFLEPIGQHIIDLGDDPKNDT